MKKRGADSERSRPRLSKETLRVLVDGDLEQARGGEHGVVRQVAAKDVTRYCPTTEP